MPCIKIIDAVKIYVYSRDHNPSHFHAIYAEYEELILIRDLKTYSGSIPKTKRKKIVEWAEKHQAYLMDKWNELNPS